MFNQDGNPETRALVPFMDNAQAEGNLSDATRKLIGTEEVQRKIAISRGTSSSQLPGEDRTIATLLMDDSTSMSGRRDAVIKGQNRIIDGLRNKAPNPDRVLVSSQVLNGGNEGIIDPYHPLAQAVRLDRTNYHPDGWTPLIPRIIQVLGSVIIKAQEVRDDWKSARTATMIMSDGEDTSGKDPKEIAALISDMKKAGSHLVAAMGFGDKYYFREFFGECGIEPGWIFTADAKDEEILEAFGLFAEVATQAADETKFPLLLKSGTGFEDIKRILGKG